MVDPFQSISTPKSKMWHTFSEYLCHSKHTHAVIQNWDPKPPPQTSSTGTVGSVKTHLHRLGHLSTFIARLLHLPEAHKDLAVGRSSRSSGFYWSGTGSEEVLCHLCHLCHLCPIFESPTPHNTPQHASGKECLLC